MLRHGKADKTISGVVRCARHESALAPERDRGQEIVRRELSTLSHLTCGECASRDRLGKGGALPAELSSGWTPGAPFWAALLVPEFQHILGNS